MSPCCISCKSDLFATFTLVLSSDDKLPQVGAKPGCINTESKLHTYQFNSCYLHTIHYMTWTIIAYFFLIELSHYKMHVCMDYLYFYVYAHVCVCIYYFSFALSLSFTCMYASFISIHVLMYYIVIFCYKIWIKMPWIPDNILCTM